MLSGVACVKLARQFCSSDYLSLAVNSLTSAHANSVIPLPIVSLLLAQAEGSLGLKQNWEKNLRLEWYSWPPGMNCLRYRISFYCLQNSEMPIFLLAHFASNCTVFSSVLLMLEFHRVQTF